MHEDIFMGCVTQCTYDQHDQSSGDVAFLGADGKLFCMDPYAADSKVVSTRTKSGPSLRLL